MVHWDLRTLHFLALDNSAAIWFAAKKIQDATPPLLLSPYDKGKNDKYVSVQIDQEHLN